MCHPSEIQQLNEKIDYLIKLVEPKKSRKPVSPTLYSQVADFARASNEKLTATAACMLITGKRDRSTVVAVAAALRKAGYYPYKTGGLKIYDLSTPHKK